MGALLIYDYFGENEQSGDDEEDDLADDDTTEDWDTDDPGSDIIFDPGPAITKIVSMLKPEQKARVMLWVMEAIRILNLTR